MSTLIENVNKIVNAKASLKTAIEAKGQTVGDISLSGYAAKVSAIAGTDVSSTTARPQDVRIGQVFFDSTGTEQEGTILGIGPTRYTPTTSDQAILSGRYVQGNIIIAGDANLVAGNIKKNTSIFGVSGTYEGSAEAFQNKIKIEDYIPYSAAVPQQRIYTVQAPLSMSGPTSPSGVYYQTESTKTFGNTGAIYKCSNGFYLFAAYPPSTGSYYYTWVGQDNASGHIWMFYQGDPETTSIYGQIYQNDSTNTRMHPDEVTTWYYPSYISSLSMTYTTTPGSSATNESWTQYKATSYDDTNKIYSWGTATSHLSLSATVSKVIDGGIYLQRGQKTLQTPRLGYDTLVPDNLVLYLNADDYSASARSFSSSQCWKLFRHRSKIWLQRK